MSLRFCTLRSFFTSKTFSFLLNLIIYALAILLSPSETVMFLWSYLCPSYLSLSRSSFSSLILLMQYGKKSQKYLHFIDRFYLTFFNVLFTISNAILIFFIDICIFFFATYFGFHISILLFDPDVSLITPFWRSFSSWIFLLLLLLTHQEYNL